MICNDLHQRGQIGGPFAPENESFSGDRVGKPEDRSMERLAPSRAIKAFREDPRRS